MQALRSGVNRRILASFVAAGIAIPPPRRLFLSEPADERKLES